MIFLFLKNCLKMNLLAHTEAIIIHENPELSLLISAHAASRGTDKYNLWLSDRRAKQTVDYLIGLDVNQARHATKGYCECQIANECRNEVSSTSLKHSYY